MHRRNRFLARAGLIVGGLALVSWWTLAFSAWRAGALFTHLTYWNAPVGTISVFIVLAVVTPAWLWAVYRFWNWSGHLSAK